MNELTRMVSPEAKKAVLAHQRNFAYGQGRMNGVEVVALVDRTGDPNVVTYIGTGEDGVSFGRVALPEPHGVSASIQEALDAAASRGSPIKVILSEVLDFFGMRGRPSTFEGFFASSFRVRNPNLAVDESDLRNIGSALLVAAGSQGAATRLDGSALQALSCIRDFDRAAYSFYALAGPRGEARRQAAGVFPLLAGDFTAKPVLKIAIDERRPLTELLERSYGTDERGSPYLSKALQRRLQGVRYSDHGIPAVSLIKILGEIPPDWFPKTQDEWDAFCKLSDVGFRFLASEIDERVDRLAAGAAGKWSELAARVAKAAASTFPPDDLNEEARRAWRPVGDSSAEGLNASFRSVHDMVSQFRDQVVLPVVADGETERDITLGMESRHLAFKAAARLLFSGKSLPAIMEMQRDWHVQIPKILEATGRQTHRAIVRAQEKKVAEDGWAPLCDIWVAPNGVSIVPLTDERELVAEGTHGKDSDGIEGLYHCVGGYAQTCRGGGHILSLRFVESDGSFVRLSTAEIGKIPEEGSVLSVRQNRGKKNGAPKEEAKAALDWFLHEVANGRIPLNRDGVMGYLQGKRRITDEIERRAGYDRRDREIVGHVLDAWRPFLPKRLRDADISKLREAPEMSDLVQEVAPAYRSVFALTF